MSSKTCHISPKIFLFIFIIIVCTSIVGASFPITITKKLNRSYGFRGIHYIIAGGVTPERCVGKREIKGLVTLSTRRLRLINVDNNTIEFKNSNKMVVHWCKHLINGLELCKRNEWVPRIIIGQTFPESLRRIATSKNYGAAKIFWEKYNQYVVSFLKYVIENWGFKETEWEVGNEMNNPKFNWVQKNANILNSSQNGFLSYMALYQIISSSIRKFQSDHPDNVMKIGGPASSPIGFLNIDLFGYRNWVIRFIKEIKRRRLPCDFISMHMYGNAASVKKFTDAIRKKRKVMRGKS